MMLTSFKIFFLFFWSICSVRAQIHSKEFYIDKFSMWVQDFNAFDVDLEESGWAFQNFVRNSDLIENFNLENASFKLGHNKFSHLSHQQWLEKMKFNPILKISSKISMPRLKDQEIISTSATEIDW